MEVEEFGKTKISVVMPVYNEKNTINEILKKVQAINIPKEIILVDDFSTDGTREILKNITDKNVKVIFQPKNFGKGFALRTGFKYVTGEIVIIQDADLEYEPNDYYNLVQPIIDGKTDVVYGTRFPRKRGHPSILHPYFSLINPFYFANKVLTTMANLLYKTNITDEPTCYKVFKAEVLKNIQLKCMRFEFCPEVTAKVRKKGYKIHEVPIEYNPRSIKEGKKINWRDGIEAIWTLIKYKFTD